MPVENPGHECEIAGCRFSGEAIDIKIKAFPRKARQKPGFESPLEHQKRDGQQAVSFAAVLPVENPGHECEIAGCRFSGEAIAIKIKAFPRKARQKAGVRIPAGAPTQNRLKRGGFLRI